MSKLMKNRMKNREKLKDHKSSMCAVTATVFTVLSPNCHIFLLKLPKLSPIMGPNVHLLDIMSPKMKGS